MVTLRRRWFAALLLGSGVAWTWSDATGALPPITGELSGKFHPPALAGTPAIDWKVAITPLREGGRHLEVDLTTKGGRLHAKADIDATMANGRWEIVEGELEAAAWLAVLAPKLGSTMENISVEGKLQLSGKGVIKNGQPAGVMQLEWTNGVVRNTVEGWSLEGIAIKGDLAIEFPDLGTLRSEHPWALAVRTISSPRFGARNLAIVANLNGDGTASLLSAEIEIAGGKVTVDPSTVALFPPVLDFTVHVDRVGLQDLVALVPASLADARGRIDGVVRLGWSQRAGVQIGEGRFDLRRDEAATLKLAPMPGLITSAVTERLDLLPKWKGVVGNWFSPPNPAHGDARDIELGRAPLTIETFQVRLTPRGDAQGRTAVVQVSARLEKADVRVKRVMFDIDLTGALSRLLSLNAEGRTKFTVQVQ